MNLSQDEINSMLTGNPSDGGDSEAAVEIMSPEDIAAMLDAAADSATQADVADGEQTSSEEETVDILSPGDIAAMLDAAVDAPPADDIVSGVDEAEPSVHDSARGPVEITSKEGMLTAEEIDILGEIGNISMGAVATTMYSLLDRRVSITTPRVHVYEAKDVLTIYNVPFVVATIEYVEGISGTNLLVLRVEDTAIITDILMGGDGKVAEPIELNEMHLSAMSEVMNQMMGASSTSLSKLLHMQINISPPKSTQVDAGFDVSTVLGDTDLVTKISFDMEIEGLLKSELIQLSPYEVSRQFARQFLDINMASSSAGSSKSAAPQASQPAPAPPAPPAPAPVPPPPPAPAPQPEPSQPPLQPMPSPYQLPYPLDAYQQAPYPQPYQQAPYPPPYPPPAVAQGRLVDVHPMQFQSFDGSSPVGETKGMDLVYNIPLQVTVELGKTKKEISEILEFSAGTIVVLDKVAGDPVEIVVNGKLIARGEVVVIDENYGVRITDIVNG